MKNINKLKKEANEKRNEVFKKFLVEEIKDLDGMSYEQAKEEFEDQVDGWGEKIDLLGIEYGMGELINQVDPLRFEQMLDEQIRDLDYEDADFIINRLEGLSLSFYKIGSDYFRVYEVDEIINKWDDLDDDYSSDDNNEVYKAIFKQLEKINFLENVSELERIRLVQFLEKHNIEWAEIVKKELFNSSEELELSKCLTTGADLK